MNDEIVLIVPIERVIEVPWTVERSFRRFTEEIGSWWPTRQFSIGLESSEAVIFESGVGGRVYERIRNGDTALWGTVLEWNPPHGFAMTWHPGRDPGEATRLAVTFEPSGNGCTVRLSHSGWEALGAAAAETRQGYQDGWATVLGFYLNMSEDLKT